MYEVWLAAGGVPDPYVPPPELGPGRFAGGPRAAQSLNLIRELDGQPDRRLQAIEVDLILSGRRESAERLGSKFANVGKPEAQVRSVCSNS